MKRLPTALMPAWLLAATLLAWTLPATARQLADPTRPPAGLSAPDEASPDDSAARGPRLQSILIARAPGGRRLAVIDGVTVHEGGKVGNAVLTRINDASVVLRRGKNLETLTLFPVPAKAADLTGKP